MTEKSSTFRKPLVHEECIERIDALKAKLRTTEAALAESREEERKWTLSATTFERELVAAKAEHRTLLVKVRRLLLSMRGYVGPSEAIGLIDAALKERP